MNEGLKGMRSLKETIMPCPGQMNAGKLLTGLSGKFLHRQTGNPKENFVVLKIKERRKVAVNSGVTTKGKEGTYLTGEEDKLCR